MENPSQKLDPQSVEKKKSKLWIILGGIFVSLILILSVAIYFYWQYKTTDHLIKFAPVDSVVYVQAHNPIWPWQEYNIADLPFDSFYQHLNETFNFPDSIFKDAALPSVSQVALLLLPDPESQSLESILLFKINNPLEIFCSKCRDFNEKIKTSLLERSNSLEIEKGIIVLASSPEVLERIKDVKERKTFSLATQIDLKKKGRGLVSLYLNGGNIKTYLNQNQDLSNKIFGQLVNQDIYLLLNKKGDQWRFKIVGDDFPSIQTTQSIIEYLPKDFSVFIQQVNLSQIFSVWGEADLVFGEFFKQTSDSLKTIYNFDFANGLDFLNQSADLIIFNTGDVSALGVDYVLVFSQLSDEQINGFEELIKIILAQKSPKQISRFLPDGTKVIELLANTDAWQWQADDSGINYLQAPSIDFEISYLVDDNKMIVSSSAERLNNFISSQDIVLADLVSQCGDGSSSLIFNSNNTFPNLDIYLPEGMTVVKEGNMGCIINF